MKVCKMFIVAILSCKHKKIDNLRQKVVDFFIQSEGLVCNRRQAYVISEAVWHHLGVFLLRIDYMPFFERITSTTSL